MSPLFLPGEQVAVAKRYVIQLDRSDRKIATKLDVHPATGAKRQFHIRIEVFNFSVDASNQRVRKSFDSAPASGEARPEQEIESADLDVRSEYLELFPVITEVANNPKVSRKIAGNAEPHSVQTFALLDERVVTGVEWIVDVDIEAEVRITDVNLGFRVIALCVSWNREKQRRKEKQQQSLHSKKSLQVCFGPVGPRKILQE